MSTRLFVVAASVIAVAGDWVSTPEGSRVCRLAFTPMYGATIQEGFCEHWQEPYYRVQRGHLLPFRDGWIRRRYPGWVTRWGEIQVHVEGKGWVP